MMTKIPVEAIASRRQILKFGLFAGVGATISLVSTPTLAYEVSIDPPDPELGDTIAVIVQPLQAAAALPRVTLDDQTYPCYPISGNRFRTLLPTSPLDSPGRKVVRVMGEEPTRNLAVWLKNRFFSTQRITLPPDRTNLGTDYEFDRVAAFKQIVSPERLWSGPMLRPSQGRVSTPYGVRRYYNGVFAEDYYHRGVDYAASTGSAVASPAAGNIRLVGRVADGFELHGNTIGIDHGQGVLSIMIHLSRIDVAEGDYVQAGQVIGAIGNTGAVTGPHLHWGLYVHGVAVDPEPWRDRGFE